MNVGPALQFMRKHSIAVMAFGTVGLCCYWEASSTRCNVARYAATQQVLTQSVDSATLEVRERLQAVDAKFEAAMAQREQLTKAFQNQTTDQKKSIARLEAALRFCSHRGAHSPAVTAMNENAIATSIAGTD